MIFLQNKKCTANLFLDLLFYAFLIIIHRFLDKFVLTIFLSQKLGNLQLRQGSF